MKEVYEELKEKFKETILKEKELSRDKLIEWIKEHSIGTLTLIAIIEDLKREKLVKVVYDDKTLIDLPKYVKASLKKAEKESVKQALTPKSAQKSPHAPKIKKKIKKRVKTSSLITQFFEEKSVEESVKKVQEVKEKKSIQSLPIPEEDKEFFKEIKDEDYRKALMYLAKYRSVGDIRFMLDLQKNGVKDVQRIIRRMVEEGYAEWVPLGVINATEKLPKVKSIFTLSDILS